MGSVRCSVQLWSQPLAGLFSRRHCQKVCAVKLSRHGKSPGRAKSWVTLELGDPIRTEVDPILNHRVRCSWCGICLSYILDKEEIECYCSPMLFYYFIWPKAPRKHKGWVMSLSYVPFKWQGIKCQWLNLFSTVELVVFQLSSVFVFFFFFLVQQTPAAGLESS